ncbi:MULTISPECIES: gp53-like domain-containing protein [Pseudomonas]|uniref:gp53-like domain-containing protein n=1 Tax=Pseudomonas TaxID=286 RepID=UPI003EBC1BA0
MTPARVFQAIAKLVKQATETAFGWAKIATQEQVTVGTDDTVIVTPKKLRAAQATQAEAEAGTDNTKIMTALRVVQTIRSAAATATEALQGVLRIGTQAEVSAGTLDNVVVTPAKMRGGLLYSLTENGYIVLPSWLLGITFMWGTTQTNGSGVGTTTFPLAFPTVCWHVLGTGRATNPLLIGIWGGSGAPTQTGYTWCASTINGSPGVLGIDWIAIGR